MEIRIDENGKFFTSHINKDPHRVIIHTLQHLVIGNVHVHPDQRIKDEINHSLERFLAITDVLVYTVDGKTLLYMSDFLLTAYAQIISITPLESVKMFGDLPWAQDMLKETP